MVWLEPLILYSKHCALEPLSHNHHDTLVEAIKIGKLRPLLITACGPVILYGTIYHMVF